MFVEDIILKKKKTLPQNPSRRTIECCVPAPGPLCITCSANRHSVSYLSIYCIGVSFCVLELYQVIVL